VVPEEETWARFEQVVLPAPGTRMTLRNAGEDPLILYRLTLVPTKADAPDVGTPAS
jgi:hypothetical protein